VKEATLCPMWDETLIFEKLHIYGMHEDVLQNPPLVTVEVFDQDLIVSIKCLIQSATGHRGSV